MQLNSSISSVTERIRLQGIRRNLKSGKEHIDMIKNFFWRITHSFDVVKRNGRWVIFMKEKGEWFMLADKRFLSEKNALCEVKEIKKRGYV